MAGGSLCAMSRTVLALWILTIAAVATAAPANAEDAVVVLDRGSGSADTAARDQDLATRLVTSLRARDVRTRLIVCGTRPNGRTRAAELRGDPRTTLAEVLTREGFGFEAGTDPRVGLEIAVRRVGDVGSLSVFLVGAFADEGEREDAGVEALTKWSARAPAESRIFTLGMAEARRGVLATAKGRLVDGAVILGAGSVEVDAEPFSPLAPEDGPAPHLRADLRVPLELATSGIGPIRPLLQAESSLAPDACTPLPPSDDSVGFRLTREPALGRVATVSFRVPDAPDILWLVEPPLPRTFTWTRLAPDARLQSRTGGPPLPFAVAEAWVGEPHRVAYRLLRSLAGSAPIWEARAEEASLPPGLDVRFGDEVALDDETAYRPVTVTFAATPGRPLEARGALVIRSPDHPATFRLPYQVRVPQGLVAVKLEAPDTPQALPPTPDAPWWRLVVEARNANVPAFVDVAWRVEPPAAAPMLAIEMQGKDGLVIWPAGSHRRLEPGVRYLVRPTPWPMDATVPEAVLTLEVPEQEGAAGVAEGRGGTRPRRPAIVAGEPAEATYRVEDGAVIGDPPLTLILDADGGVGAWQLALLAIPPEVASDGNAPVSWDVEPAGAGAWHLVPTGAWRGTRSGIFTGRTDLLRVDVTWPAGGAPGTLEIPVLVPARWGPAGWILVVLAALALALGGWGLWQLRPTPVEGTLLYTMADRAKAVGRLDLAGVGRRTTLVRSDGAGRLHLGGKGASVLQIRPTRVGGLLRLETQAGPEEHLLVDGLTVDAGSHRVRYVLGHDQDVRPPSPPPRVEDLLGPDFDLPTGRFDQLTAKRVQEEEGEAETPSVRS